MTTNSGWNVFDVFVWLDRLQCFHRALIQGTHLINIITRYCCKIFEWRVAKSLNELLLNRCLSEFEPVESLSRMMQPGLQQTIDQKLSFIMGLWWGREGSEHAHARPLDKTRESWRLIGWLDRAMPRLSNNDGLPTSLLRSRPIQQTLCQKKSGVGTQNIIDLKSLLTRVSIRLNIACTRKGGIS